MIMQSNNDNNNMSSTNDSSVNNNEGDDNSQNGDAELDRNGQHHPVAEFLYQLTKMLTDDNSEIIEWVDGRIKVHYPDRLEAEVLHKYFRHSKFASFQRQLNYFGFRKIAGKGKMSPCSYVNDAATSDIRSLLLIKRKTNGSAARKAAMQQRAAALNLGSFPFSALAANPAAMAAAATLNPQALTSAMALLSDSALRNGFLQQVSQGQSQSTQLGLLALQQQQLQQQQQHNLLTQSLQQRSTESAADHHQQALQHQQQLQQLQQRFHGLSKAQSGGSGQGGNMAAPAPTSGAVDTSNFGSPSAPQSAPASDTPSLEQLHANLAATLTGQLGSFANSLGVASLPSNVGSSNAPTAGAASAALANAARQASNASSADNPATAALQNLSATAAVNAATDAASAPAVGGSIFESALNLESLLQEYQANESSRQQQEQERQRKNLAGSFKQSRQPSVNEPFAVFGNNLPEHGLVWQYGEHGDWKLEPLVVLVEPEQSGQFARGFSRRLGGPTSGKLSCRRRLAVFLWCSHGC